MRDRIKLKIGGVMLITAAMLIGATSAQAQWIKIGRHGNVADTVGAGYGSVGYEYRIGQYAVTVAQWNDFYGDGSSGPAGIGGGTAVGVDGFASDSGDISSYNRWTSGQTRNITLGTNSPVVSVSFHQAAQYANWLTSGDATVGVYTIDGNGVVTSMVGRSSNAMMALLDQFGTVYAVPTEDEWYKAAYYNLAEGVYYQTAAGNNEVVPQAIATSQEEYDTLGAESGWNYNRGISYKRELGQPWEMGTGTQEQNATYDMMGNTFEWIEDLSGVRRGGACTTAESTVRSSGRNTQHDADVMDTFTGFRLVSLAARQPRLVYVSPTGSDTNEGDETAPFRTIQKAASVMLPGDVCIIAEGRYKETVTPASDGVTFRAAPGAEVVVSGYERVTDWTVHQGSIYSAQLTWDLGDQNHVLYNGQMMNLARWPSKTNYDPFDLQALWAPGTRNSNEHIAHPEIPDWDWSNGGVVFFLGRHRWTSWRRPITSSEAGMIYFETLPASWDYAGEHSPTISGEFFLQNILQALNSEGEWYIDRNLQKIYFWAPGGGNPADGTTLVRRRTTAFNLTGRKNVTIDGLTILGGQINLNAATDCVVKHCKIHYGNFTIASNSAHSVPQSSIQFNGQSKDNLIYRNDIQWGAANGIRLLGHRNTVDANYIGNFNWLASYAAPIFVAGDYVRVIRNEIFNAGRDLVHGGWAGAEIGYNHMHRSSLINDDCGAIYMVQSSFRFTRIHHNWIHNLHSVPGHINAYKSTGIYLDNNTRQVIVDHNVVWDVSWSGIQINWSGEDLLIYNNTLWSNPGTHCKAMDRWAAGRPMNNVQVYNTLANEGTFHGTDLSNNIVMALDANPFQDFAHRNFTPVAGSAPVDAGMIIPGYTDGFHGTAPDAGAYEFGVTPWTAGPLARMANPVPNASITAGQTLMVTISALDEPQDSLVFSLISPPEGVTIDPSTGVIEWRPTIAQSGVTYTIVVSVTNTGTPPLDATLSFDVTVARPEPPEITQAEFSDGVFTMTVSGESGMDYTLQATTDLMPPVVWMPLQTVIRADPPILLSDPTATDSDQKFYRVMLGP